MPISTALSQKCQELQFVPAKLKHYIWLFNTAAEEYSSLPKQEKWKLAPGFTRN